MRFRISMILVLNYMQKREAKFQTVFNHWAQENFKKTACFELKETDGNSLAFNRLEIHQSIALQQAKHDHFIFKITDCGYQNPFDCFSVAKVPAYVVIKYPGVFVLIDVDVFIGEEKISDRKSLTKERALEIAEITVQI